jgi:hypothetical protein
MWFILFTLAIPIELGKFTAWLMVRMLKTRENDGADDRNYRPFAAVVAIAQLHFFETAFSFPHREDRTRVSK